MTFIKQSVNREEIVYVEEKRVDFCTTRTTEGSNMLTNSGILCGMEMVWPGG